MEAHEPTGPLDAILARLDTLANRLDRLEHAIEDAAALREKLAHEQRSRTALAEQTSWLIEILGDARKEIRWLKAERERLAKGG